MLEQISQIFELLGFSGDCTVGHRISGELQTDIEHAPDPIAMPLQRQNNESNEEVDESDDESAQVGSLVDYIALLMFT